MRKSVSILSILSSMWGVAAWTAPRVSNNLKWSNVALHASVQSTGSLHGQNSCFLPLEQLDQEYYAPRILQVSRYISFIMSY